MTEIYESLVQAIHQGNLNNGVAEALKLVEAGINPVKIFSDCIEPTLVEVGDRFSRLEIFLPEMINSADTVKAIQKALLPYIKSGESNITKGRIVIGTVSGDLHDIGKNIVKTMLEVNGFEVKDLGVDVNPGDVIKAAVDFNADVIALSALMLPSLPYVKDVIDTLEGIEKYRHRFKVMVGGGPVSREWARKAGANGYGDDAVEAVQVAHALLEETNEITGPEAGEKRDNRA